MSTRQEKITAEAQKLLGKWIRDDLISISPGVWLYAPSDGQNQKIVNIDVASYYAHMLIQMQEFEEDMSARMEHVEHASIVQRRAEYADARNQRQRRDRPTTASVTPPQSAQARRERSQQVASHLLTSWGVSTVTSSPPEPVPYPPTPQRVYPPWYIAEDIEACERLIAREAEIRSRPSRNDVFQTQFIPIWDTRAVPVTPGGGMVEYDSRREGWLVSTPVPEVQTVEASGFTTVDDLALLYPESPPNREVE